MPSLCAGWQLGSHSVAVYRVKATQIDPSLGSIAIDGWRSSPPGMAVLRRSRIQRPPRSLTYQLDLLRRVGFARTEVLHKNGCFAAFGGIRD